MMCRNYQMLTLLVAVVLTFGEGAANAATWNGGAGTWNTPSKWSTSDVPDTVGETADINAAGTYTVTLDISPTIGGLTLNSANATLFANNQTLTVNGPFNIQSGLADFRSSDINGSGTLTNDSSLTIISTAADHAFINSAFANNGTLLIRGLNSGNHTTLEVANSFTNSGLVRLASDVGWQAHLIINSGALLTNTSTGIFRSQTLNSAGAQSITANIDNSGLIEINDNTSFSKSGATVTNNASTASFVLASGKTATFTSGIFSQSAGSTTVNSTAVMTGLSSFTLGGGTLANNGTIAAGTSFIQNSGAISGAGTISVTAGGNIDLNGGSRTGGTFSLGSGTGAVTALTITPGYLYDSSTIANGSTTIAGLFTVNSGRTFTITGGGAAPNPKVATTPAFTNNGTIVLGASGNGWGGQLSVPTGTLTNGAGGIINISNGVGSGGAAVTLAAELNNQGTLNLTNTDTNPSLGRTGAVHINTGTINVNVQDGVVGGSVTDTFSITGTSFTQTAGEFILTKGKVNFSTPSVSFIGGTIKGGAGSLNTNVNATAGGTGLTLSPGQSTGILDINGSVLLNGNDNLLIEIGGTNQGALVNGYDFLDVSSGITLGGSTLNIQLVGGFTPGALDSFTILTALGGVTGTFSNTPLIPSGLGAYQFNVTYNANSVVLTAVYVPPVPEPSSFLLLGLGLLSLARRRKGCAAK